MSSHTEEKSADYQRERNTELGGKKQNGNAPHSPTLATGNPHAHVMLTMRPF